MKIYIVIAQWPIYSDLFTLSFDNLNRQTLCHFNIELKMSSKKT